MLVKPVIEARERLIPVKAPAEHALNALATARAPPTGLCERLLHPKQAGDNGR